jgi:amino acid transporter
LNPARSEPSGDTGQLAEFGYRQQLKRTIHGFSSFALSFSLISMTTGIFANFGQGIRHFGPAVVWSWLLVVAGQFVVALVLAELSTYYPLTGYGYQWTSRLVNPHYGFFVGWILLLQFLTGFPGVCSALGEYLRVFPGLPKLSGISAPTITVAIITLIALIHIFGIRLAALLNDAGVIAEIVGSILVALVLLALYGFNHPDGFAVLRNTTNAYTGRPAGLQGFALSLLMGAWCLTGFEAAADMAEETHQPASVVPKAIIISELSAGLGGFVVLLGFVLAMPNLKAAQASATPLSDILQARLGGAVTNAVMVIVFVSIFACGLASLAATTRVIFSMSRDNMLPGSSLWKRVGSRSGTPVAAIILVWAISCALVIGLKKLELITSISAVAGFLGYAGILYAAARGMRGKKRSAGFSLGAYQTPLSLAALLWSLLLVAALAVPESEPGAGHTPAIATCIGLAAGTLIYFGVVRTRLRRGLAGPPGMQS